jgi:small subunit ribosomal protein S16
MLVIRMRRMGAHARPFYRIVVSDSRKRPEGRVVDTVGYYDPLRRPRVTELDVAKVESWIAKGAKPSDTVRDILRKQRAKARAAG